MQSIAELMSDLCESREEPSKRKDVAVPSVQLARFAHRTHHAINSPGSMVIWKKNLRPEIVELGHQRSAVINHVPSQTDLYFPPQYAEHEAQFIGNVKLVPIPSIWGHIAGLGINSTDNEFR